MVDWSRRFDHMQQHTGQHLLSAVFDDLFGIETLSFHMGAESSTIDLACAAITSDDLRSAEARANAIVQENRPVGVAFEDASAAAGLRNRPSGSDLYVLSPSIDWIAVLAAALTCAQLERSVRSCSGRLRRSGATFVWSSCAAPEPCVVQGQITTLLKCLPAYSPLH